MLTTDLEIKLVPNVGAAWQTVALENTYSDAIVVCKHNLVSSASPSATTRIRNVTATSFQLRLQQFENSSIVPTSNVHCVIADEGAYNSGGLKYEARKVVSDGTSGLSVPGGWGIVNNENVTSAITQTYANPHVVGQVMSFNDANASVFWNYDCETRGNGAFFSGQADGICVGKHIGQINGTRANETLGYIVLEAGSATVNDISFTTAVGADTGAGVGNSPPYNYSVSGDYDIGVVEQQGEDGGQGGWAILYGSNPLPNNSVQWAIEEEIVAGDTSRSHTTENVAYWLFDNNQAPTLAAQKTVTEYSGNSSPYMIPGSEAVYTISVENTGSGPVDDDSLFLTDRLPDALGFFTGDFNDGGPGTDMVAFQSTDSGLTFTQATDLGFSDSATAPANMSQCNYIPTDTYDTGVTYICFAPQGEFSEGTITPSSYSLSFRARVE
ncbi:hypothetical protein ACJ3XI_07805 [Litorimonas sp. RW-G-Af-16]|uniref:hypothetical protein n=1 Tax=Litorimonas sp. RW-G-Af-16 TaxID=3241168 RepID=UPI00390C597F